MKKEEREFKLFARDHGVSSIKVDQFAKIVNNGTFNPMSMATLPTSMTPYIMEERQLNVAQIDVFSRLMMDRIIFLGTGIDDQVANIINAQLLFLDSSDSKKDITIYMNSPGGSVYAGLGIYDTMQYISPDIITVNTGIAASMAYVLAVAGTKGKRASLTHARYMQHQPMGGIGAGTQASDMDITVKEINKLKKELYDIISRHTGQPYDKVLSDCDRDHWMTSVEAKEYGCIDQILKPKKTK